MTAFTLFMAIGTFNHLDRFETQHVAFWIWVGLYVTTPVLVPLAWWRNRATDPGTPEPGEPPLPRHVRTALFVVGAGQSLVALVLLLSPSTMIEHWPWLLTPLTAQTLGGWFALPGVTALMMALDGRWSAIRITLESQLIGLALILLGTARAWSDIDTSNSLAYAFVGGLSVLFLALLALEWRMLSPQRPALRSLRHARHKGRQRRRDRRASPTARSATRSRSTSSRTPTASPRSSRSSCTSTSTAG